MVASVSDVLVMKLLDDIKLLGSELAVFVAVVMDRLSALLRKSEVAIGSGFTRN